MSPIDPALVAERLRRATEAISAAGGDPGAVAIIAMTKGFGPDAPRAAREVGLVDCGENVAQELVAKAHEVDGVRWHFTGRLQSNKVRLVADHVVLWQTIDRASLVAEVAKRAPGAAVLVQVNASAEPQKGGIEPTAVAALVATARTAGLDVRGLMTVGVAGDDGATRKAFDDVVALADELELVERSFGMSGDLATAVAAGSTMVRLGTALFGERPEKT